MSDATAAESALPEGWYTDPADNAMQRWWTGSAWTDHVRYAEKPRLFALAAPSQPEPVLAPQPAVPSLQAPSLQAPSWQPAITAPQATTWQPAVTEPVWQPSMMAPPTSRESSGLDDFYVPMREPSARPSTTQLSSSPIAAGLIWFLIIAVTGVAVGVALWLLLP